MHVSAARSGLAERKEKKKRERKKSSGIFHLYDQPKKKEWKRKKRKKTLNPWHKNRYDSIGEGERK